MAYCCALYGLGLSVNVPLAALSRLPSAERIDVQIWLGPLPAWYREIRNSSATPIYTSEYRETDGEAALKVRKLAGGTFFEFIYCDGTRLLINRQGTQVWAEGPASVPLEDTATYILGPVLGFVLRLRGTLCLHASAVNIDGQAITFLGPPGAGKSTTAARFANLGYPALTDDVTALREQACVFMVQPGYPRLNLWPDASETLYGSADALPLITPTWDKLYLDLLTENYNFQQVPLPFAAIYILDARSSDSSAPFIEPVNAAEGLMALVANTSTNYLLDAAMRKQEFESLSRLVQQVDIRRVTPHADPALLPQLCELILDDIRTLKTTVPGSSYV